MNLSNQAKESYMPSRRKPKRNYRMIAFKVYYDTDQDILDWWNNIEDGERSDEIRDVIRDYLEENPKPRRKILEIPELLDVRRDTLWIKDALNDMPAYLERMMEDVARNWQPMIVSQTQARASPEEVQPNDPALTDSESQRRTRRMKNATW
jgi:hypothetical protein